MRIRTTVHHAHRGRYTEWHLSNGASFQFDWTPPATNAGLVTLYAAGNAANGNGSPTGDQIYTTSVQLTPVVAAAPSVPAGSIVSSATGVAGPIAANSWVTIPDELYANMRGPGENMTVLSTAWSDPANRGTNHDEPILMVLTYGKGRIFHTVMGHDLAALNCVGFIVTYQRGTEWAATGKVTQKAPADFPKADKTSTRAAYNPPDGWVSPPANRAAPAKK